tara:strand:- start:638 stop:937 length:300 start_codon:yes stop_codon:yes gene_type:complete
MDNVIDIKSKRGLNELQELKKTLAYCYEQIERTYECLHEMEESLECIQETYNKKLVDVVTNLGADSVTIAELDYATNIIVENGKIDLMSSIGSWELEKE